MECMNESMDEMRNRNKCTHLYTFVPERIHYVDAKVSRIDAVVLWKRQERKYEISIRDV